MELDIVYRDDFIVAINKPSGMLVHKTTLAADVKSGFALQLLRNQINRYVHPLHRIDRPTSGILLFALDPETASLMGELFNTGHIDKRYLAICRGHFPDQLTTDKPLRKEKDKAYQPATTSFRAIAKSTLPIPNDRYATTRLSLIEAKPVTGRMHQIRKHLKHLGYPIVGDTTYGDLKFNQRINEHLGGKSLCLHAQRVEFIHPITKQIVNINCNSPVERFQNLIHNIQTE